MMLPVFCSRSARYDISYCKSAMFAILPPIILRCNRPVKQLQPNQISQQTQRYSAAKTYLRRTWRPQFEVWHHGSPHQKHRIGCGATLLVNQSQQRLRHKFRRLRRRKTDTGRRDHMTPRIIRLHAPVQAAIRQRVEKCRRKIAEIKNRWVAKQCRQRHKLPPQSARIDIYNAYAPSACSSARAEAFFKSGNPNGFERVHLACAIQVCESAPLPTTVILWRRSIIAL